MIVFLAAILPATAAGYLLYGAWDHVSAWWTGLRELTLSAEIAVIVSGLLAAFLVAWAVVRVAGFGKRSRVARAVGRVEGVGRKVVPR